MDDFSSVRRVHITEKDVVVEMLRIVYMDHPRVGFLVVKGREEETKRNMEWFWGVMFGWIFFFVYLFCFSCFGGGDICSFFCIFI